MSDLHKSFLKKIKEQEQSLGLESLSEDPLGEEPPSNCGGDHSNINLESSISDQLDAESIDNELLKALNEAKTNTFPVIEIFHDLESNTSFQTYYKPPSNPRAPIFVCHHGAGSSAMTFCKLAQTLERVHKETSSTHEETPGVFAFDMRGHGNSTMPTPLNYSLNRLTEDFSFALAKFVSTHKPSNSLYLVGHSLGGSVLTNYVTQNPASQYNIKGLVMIDIVEETAVKSLVAMPQFIKKRPISFPTYQRAIDWHVWHIKLVNNIASANISIPDLLINSSKGIVWRTNLEETQPFWESWFSGLSENFVKCSGQNKIAKLLILSGHETLDTNLIIGQMQGKYQLIVFNNSAHTGHFVQEDIPNQLAISLLDFAKRNDSPAEYMKQELGFIPKWGGKINS